MDFSISDAFRSKGRIKALANRLDHLREPEEIEQRESNVRRKITRPEPQREESNRHECRSLSNGIVQITGVGELGNFVLEILRRSVSSAGRTIDVLEHRDGAISPPDEATAEKGGNEYATIYSLNKRSCEVELITKPMDIEEWRGQLVEEEDGTVIIDEWALCPDQ